MDVIIPSNPADKKKIEDALDQISSAWTRVSDERSYVNDTLGKLNEDFPDIPKKIFRKMAKAHHEKNLKQVIEEAESLEFAYQAIVSPKAMSQQEGYDE